MPINLLRYDRMIEEALRGVVRRALRMVAATGLPGSHHFFITFRTTAEGVQIADYLRERYPDEMTIVIQHQFWGLDVTSEQFAITLSFNDVHERLVIPFAAITSFADPAAQFGLQFQQATGASDGEEAEDKSAKAPKAPAVPPTRLPAPALKNETDEPAAEAPKDEGKEGEAKEGSVVFLDQFRRK
ncbi:SspB family protein [Elstera cyanobacteriorum]|uniref:Stringent starvation protein B n=1 Tax=Elstera cyanobacteriorum TaxID=2022747 RepID=A0A255XMH3_9PROT|nr:ClpXP protease specificity-enhancing factor SspB [Elstera cyanobacteriorum]MCK6441127.1 ClpXP protease specificity-enhancing factor SspB [Elstera cyanobacteriorum]OYQ18183.1 hypothetical protein CHR90_14620 [Elstera cyanobacteriorum]GFZ83168.1 hypothetical protein GCM10011497_09850 [Elstera cyanobacteriorum]